MIFQQRISLTTSPIKTQESETSILPVVKLFFLARIDTMNADSASVRRIEYENERVEDGHTHVDMIVTAEASTVEFFDLFLKSFLRRDESFPFILDKHDYEGL